VLSVLLARATLQEQLMAEDARAPQSPGVGAAAREDGSEWCGECQGAIPLAEWANHEYAHELEWRDRQDLKRCEVAIQTKSSEGCRAAAGQAPALQ
jgi:hypothetical protein